MAGGGHLKNLGKHPHWFALVALACLLLAGAAWIALAGRGVPEPREQAPLAPDAAEDETLARMIGQMIIVGFDGTQAGDSGMEAVHRQLRNGTVGGVMLLARNIRSPEQVRTLNSELRQAAGAVVPFLAIDQEGGTVQRLNPANGHAAFPSAEQVAAGADPPEARAIYERLAQQVREAGFNVNFGPVLDLSSEPDNPIIARRGRSYGADPERVATFARQFAAAHRSARVLTAAKHFPGHGSSRADSHHDVTDIAQSWRETELEPYAVLIGEGVIDMVMLGHLHLPRFSDDPALPASLSARTVAALRGQIGFDGVIVSDDLEMGALAAIPLEERIVRAVNAGVDLLLFANFPEPRDDLGARVHGIILQAVRSGAVERRRIEAAHERIMRLKERLQGPRDDAA